MKKLAILTAAALITTAAGMLHAQTTGYLFYAGGGVATVGDATAQDGTLTADNGVFSVLVATVTIDSTSVTIDNWRYAAGAGLGNPMPEDNPNTTETEAASWLFTEDTVFAIDGRLYVIGGDWNGDSARTTSEFGIYADIDPDGQLGAWDFTAEFPTPPEGQGIGAAAHANFGGTDYVYYLGGTSTPLDRVLVGEVQPGGGISSWTATTPLPSGDWFNRATSAEGQIFHGAGNMVSSEERDVHYAPVQTGGTLGAWTATNDYPGSGKQWDYVMVTATSPDGTEHIVVAGGSALDGGVYTAPVTPGPSVGPWVTTNNLTANVRRVSGVAIDDVIIITGGSVDASPVSAATSLLQVGRIDNNGEITWTDSDTDPNIQPMLQPRSFGGAAFLPSTLPDPPTQAENWTLYR